jgi:hypothetical protein
LVFADAINIRAVATCSAARMSGEKVQGAQLLAINLPFVGPAHRNICCVVLDGLVTVEVDAVHVDDPISRNNV